VYGREFFLKAFSTNDRILMIKRYFSWLKLLIMADDKQKKPSEQASKESVKGFEINLNEFGEIQSNLQIEDLNKYLNQHLEDKKLADRRDYSEEE
jgi:hypothetical protein